MADHAAAVAGLPRWHPHPLVRGAIDTIRRTGWAVTAIDTECPCGSPECEPPVCAFAYTSGMCLHDIPELAVYGLDSRTARIILDTLGHLLHRYDWKLLVDREVTVDLHGTCDAPIRLVELIDKSDLLITNALFPDTPTLQVIWADDLGTFPWESGYLLQPEHQLVKGVPHLAARFAGGPRTIVGADRTRHRRAVRRIPKE